MRSMLLTALLTLSLTACGKKGALIYPDMLLPAAPTATTATQVGSAVKIQFVLPANDRTGRKLVDLAGVKINKHESGSQTEQFCSSCMTDYRMFRKLYLDLLTDGAQRYDNLILVLDSDVTIGKTYSYSIAAFTKDGLDGFASLPVQVRPVQPTLPPILRAESFPTEIRVSLVSLPPVMGRFIGYNLYRTTQQDELPYLPLNKEPFLGKDYVDRGLERNQVYHYTARTVVKMESGSVVESPASNVVNGMLKNDE